MPNWRKKRESLGLSQRDVELESELAANTIRRIESNAPGILPHTLARYIRAMAALSALEEEAIRQESIS